jgi:PHD/YefM family antitoxin component YafN of YafNO toxin-antitoxin module
MEPAHAQYIISSTGRKKAVILPIREYQRLLEDLLDLKVVVERREEYSVSLDEIKKRLANHSLSDTMTTRIN